MYLVSSCFGVWVFLHFDVVFCYQSAVNRSTSLCWELLPAEEHSLKVTHRLRCLPRWISGTFIHLLPMCPPLPCLYLWIYPPLESGSASLHCICHPSCFQSVFLCRSVVVLIFPSKTFKVAPASNAFTNDLTAEVTKMRRAESPVMSVKVDSILLFHSITTDIFVQIFLIMVISSSSLSL